MTNERDEELKRIFVSPTTANFLPLTRFISLHSPGVDARRAKSPLKLRNKTSFSRVARTFSIHYIRLSPSPLVAPHPLREEE